MEQDFDAFAYEEDLWGCLSAYYGIGNQLGIESVDTPAGHLGLLVVQAGKHDFLFWLMYDSMYEKLSLDVDELSMRYPCNNLINKYSLTLS